MNLLLERPRAVVTVKPPPESSQLSSRRSHLLRCRRRADHPTLVLVSELTHFIYEVEESRVALLALCTLGGREGTLGACVPGDDFVRCLHRTRLPAKHRLPEVDVGLLQLRRRRPWRQDPQPPTSQLWEGGFHDSSSPAGLANRAAAAPIKRAFIANDFSEAAGYHLIRYRTGTRSVPPWFPTGTFRDVYAGVSRNSVTTGLVGHHFHRNHRDPGPGHICPVRPSSPPGKQCLG